MQCLVLLMLCTRSERTDSDAATLTAAVAALDAKTVDGGDNVNTLSNTTADATPSTFYFLAVDAATGAIKVIDKNFMAASTRTPAFTEVLYAVNTTGDTWYHLLLILLN